MKSNNDKHLLLHGLLKIGMIMNKSCNQLSEDAKPMSRGSIMKQAMVSIQFSCH